MSETNVKKEKCGENPPKKKNILIIIVCAVVIFAVILGLTLGIVSLAMSKNTVMEYKGVRMDKKVAAYLMSVHKIDYMAYLRENGITAVDDTEAFWNSQSSEGGTYGEGLARSAEQYLRNVLVGVYLYNQNAEMTKETKESIEKNARENVSEYLYGTEDFEELFEEDAAGFGYDYKSYLKAAEMLYKYNAARDSIYGSRGEGAVYFPDECNEYLKLAYSHVELAFVRTESTFLIEDGKRVEEAGGYVFKDLSDAESETRKNKIESLKAQIESYKSGTGGGVVITPDTIKGVATDYESDQSTSRIEKGYYFSPESEYTESFISDSENGFDKIVETALSLELDSKGNAFGYCELSLNGYGGKERVVCFIYKSAPVEGAFADASLSDFFTDFYKDAVRFYLHPKDVNERSAEVKLKEKRYSELSPVAIPKNDKHRINLIYSEE